MPRKMIEYVFTRNAGLCYYVNKIGDKEEMQMKKISIFDVANFFLNVVDKDAGSAITPLKLQKMLYYAQGYYLAKYNSPLFIEDFQAWAHGPANPEIYEKYKKYGFSNIDDPQSVMPIFESELTEYLNYIWETFGIFDGKYLEKLTHSEKPWIDARRGYEPGERCEVVITKKAMKEFFKTNPYSV